MATVRIRGAEEYSAEEQKLFAASRAWFKIDFTPKMGRVLLALPEFRDHNGRAMKRAMPDGELRRAEKEIIAAAVSGMNSCRY
ncbi:MAG: hypothetical protein HYY96_15155 [Candidatus Tectomicrobia bacterium]|nr:hypothetical protein [Candidatus Tectomicrobia bacterium]